MPDQVRDRWGTRIGFAMAAVGSAIGLGNIWRFPYITGVHGGGAFVFSYLICISLIGIPIMVAEFVLGKSTAQGPVGAFRRLEGKKTLWIVPGFMGVATVFVILSYYSVVGGWVLDYAIKAFAGGFAAGRSPEQISLLLEELLGSASRQVWLHFTFISLTTVVVMFGVRSGIERASNVLMPSLFLILLALFFHSFTLAGSKEAWRFLFYPSADLLKPQGILEGMGHAFFTLSLGMGTMFTYGSYMRTDQSPVRSALAVAGLDTLIALIAGVVIFSIVFSFGLEPGAGPTLIFSTLPALFAQIPGGGLLAAAFFLLLLFAALTSAISMLEVIVAYFVDSRSWGRKAASMAAGFSIFLIGILSAFSYNLLAGVRLPVRFLFGLDLVFFETLDKLASNLLLPLGGLLIALYVGWRMNRDTLKAQFPDKEIKIVPLLIFLLKYVATVLVGVVFLYGFAFTHTLLKKLGL